LSENITVISFKRETDIALLQSIATPDTLRFLPLPSLGIIRQHRQGEIVTNLTDMKSDTVHSILPKLEKIRFVSTEAPYVTMQCFKKLRRLQIDMETVQWDLECNWPLLEELDLRGSIAIDPCLGAFLGRHKHLKHLHIFAVITLRQLGPSEDELHRAMTLVLSHALSTELTGSIMEYATKNAIGHERSLFQHFYVKLDEMVDNETAIYVRQIMAQFFVATMEQELERHRSAIEKLDIPLDVANQLDVSYSGDVFWKDEFAIKGLPLIDDSGDGLWINDEVKGALSISHRMAARKIGTTSNFT
jgi:hypothetical protein